MILIVRLFEAAVSMRYERPLDLVYLGIAVLFVSAALYLVHIGHKSKAEVAAGHSLPPPARVPSDL
jgi:hypothetical protein